MDEGPVDEASVRHVAALANVDLDEADVERFADQFADILTWFEALDDVPEVAEADDLHTVTRGDEVRDSLPRGDALANADDTEDGYFRGPPVG